MPTVLIRCHSLRDVTWTQATGCPADVVIYRIPLADSASLPALKRLLQPAELDRASRYHQPQDQHRFILVRGTLRILLGQRSGQHPADVRFDAGRNKKPVLAGFPEVHYNVSHAGNWGLIAIGPNPVGVDVEQLNDFRYQDVLTSGFSPRERRYIEGELAPDGGRRFRFYQLWTRKEALLKATAKGIDDDFQRIPSLNGTHRVAGELLNTTTNWVVSSFLPDDTHLAAVACPGTTTPHNLVFCDVDRELLTPPN